MLVKFRFFDKEDWSIYATIQTFIVLIIYYLGFRNLNISTLTLASLIGMMHGKLLDKLIYSFFLSMAIFSKNTFILGSILTIISTFITTIIPRNNKIYNYIIKNKLIVNLIKLSILIWFIVFLFLIKNVFHI
tara:strand:- start:473 stop:868 length:396 start_codon:yes stop_codon:yes gene_type:complete